MNNFTEIDFDFSQIESILIGLQNSSFQEPTVLNYKKDYDKDYEERTTEYYKTLRLRKMDPFINIDLEDDDAFKFEYMWDPYTGERKEKDPFGSLYFDPDSLIHYFYINRLKNLWTEPSDENGGYYQGYYDMLVGSGENINIIGRGECPEKYLFRLPIIDCYLEKDYNKSIITMGPKLTIEEVKLIDNLASKNPDNYRKMFKKPRPSLYKMKKYYDIAISSNPNIKCIVNANEDKKKEIKYKINCNAVDELRKM